jgi:thiol-disulfide isomerase/thioredoxin
MKGQGMHKQQVIMVVVLVVITALGCKQEEPSPSGPNEAATGQTGNPGTAPSQPDEAWSPPETMPSKLGDPAWSLDGLEFVKGEPVQITPGEVFVVEFWATWCPPCLTSIPHLTEVARRYKDKKVTVVGISNESAEVVRPFVEKMGEKMDYHVAVDPSGKVTKGYMEAFNRGTIPHAFIVNADANVVWVGHPMDNIELVLDQVVEGTFDPAAVAEGMESEGARFAARL